MAMPHRELVLLCGCTFLYALCFLAQAPLLPYQLKKLGSGDASTYGSLTSAFSALQLVGGLLSGPLVDARGGKWLLLVSFASSAACYVLTATATSVWMLFMSRLTTLMQHAVLAARTIVTAQSTDAERASMLGYIGAAYGLGFALGPAVGGWLSSLPPGLATAAWAAAAGSLLALGIVAAGLPSDAPSSRAGAGSAADKAGSKRGLSTSSLVAVVGCPGVPALLAVQAGAGLASSLFQATFSLVLQQQYGLSSKQNGLVLSYVGCCIVFGQAVVIKQLTKRLSEESAVMAGMAVLAVSFLAMGASRQLWQLLIALLPVAVASVTIVTTNTSRLSKAVPGSSAGTVMALDMSMGSGLRTVSPLLGTWLLQRHGYGAVCAACAGLLAAVLALQAAVLRRQRASDGGRAKAS